MKIFGREINILEANKKKTNNNKDKEKNVLDPSNIANDYLVDLLEMSRLESLQEFRKLSQDRHKQYDEYDRISEDIVISSALEMYADDACQYDAEGRIIWVEAKEKKVADFANNLLEILNVPQKIWSLAYSLAKYGDQYIETYTVEDLETYTFSSGNYKKSNGGKDKKEAYDLGEDVNFKSVKPITEVGIGKDTEIKKGNLAETIEIYDRPEDIFNIQEFGKTIGFAEIDREDKKRGEKIVTHPPKKFVHFYNERPSSRNQEVFEAKFKNKKDGEIQEMKFKVVRGKSMIHDIYVIQQIIQLLEDSLILNRLSKSSIIRLLSVEVGDMPRGEVRKLLQRIKSKLEQKLNIHVDEGQYGGYNSPGPIDNMIFLPTRNGKGALQHDSVGGDVDVRSIVDIDYFVNKKFGGLKIPKQYLGFDEPNPGMGSGLSLTKMDARYGRTIKRLQTSLIRGFTTLINYYLIDRGMANEINNFTVRMVTPTTVEDSEREEILQNRIQIASSFIMLLNELPGVDKMELVNYLSDQILRDPHLKKIIDEEKMKAEEESGDDAGF